MDSSDLERGSRRSMGSGGASGGSSNGMIADQPVYEHLPVTASAKSQTGETSSAGAREDAADCDLPSAAHVYSYNILNDTDNTQLADPNKPEPSRALADGDLFSTNFQFVEEDRVTSRTTIRKHAMREYRRRERWERGSKGATHKGGAKPSSGEQWRTPPAVASSNALTVAEEETPAEYGGPQVPSSPNRKLRVNTTGLAASIGSTGRRYLPAVEATELPLSLNSKADDKILNQNWSEAKGRDELQTPIYWSDPWAAVGAAKVDPFGRIKIECGPSSEAILHEYAWVLPREMDRRAAGIDFKRLGWLYSGLSVHDPDPTHVILSFTLSSSSRNRGTKEPAAAIEHKAKALQLVNKRLEDPIEAMSDGTIGAVLNIAGHEFFSSNADNFVIHMKGLGRIIRNRGGMASFKARSELKSVVLRLDIMRAYVSASKARYPDFTNCNTIESLFKESTSDSANVEAISTLYDGFEGEKHELCVDCINLIHGLEDVTLLINSSAARYKQAGPIPIKHHLSIAIRRLLAKRPEDTKSNTLDKCKGSCRLAALVVIDMALRQYFNISTPDEGSVPVPKLRLLDPISQCGRSLGMLIRVILNSDRMALAEPLRSWYAAEVIAIALKTNVEIWQTMEADLLNYLAVDLQANPADSLIRSLWDLNSMIQIVVDDWL